MRYIAFLLLFVSSSVWALTPISFLKINNYYDSNVVRLSDKLLDDFALGDYGDKFKIKTSDDMVTSIALAIGLKNRFPKKHTQIFKLKFLYNNYYSNTIKNNFKVSAYYKQFLSKKFTYAIEYSYFPYLYLRQYKSEFDAGVTYHDFTYSKNSYLFNFGYNFLPEFRLKGVFTYAQLYFNEYFTEYDSNDLGYKAVVRIEPIKSINVSLFYAYKKSSQINKGDATIVKDPSYESNRGGLNLSFPIIKKLSNATNITYEGRFFRSNATADIYHIGRNDYKFSLKNVFDYSLSKKINIALSYLFEKRNAKSPYNTVEDEKSYKFYQLGAGITINKLF